jgi:hypothetical protein
LIDKPLAPASNDVPDEQPTPQHVWVPGHWRWGQGSYVWVAGRWELPPVQNASWVAPQWIQQATGYVLRDGFWQQNPPPTDPALASQAMEISTNQTPPPPQPEAIPEQPSPDYVWQPGYWNWQGNQFLWVNGHWENPPRPGLQWVPTHWETRSDRYVLTFGYWRENVVVAAVQPAPAPQPVVAPQPAQQIVVVTPPPPPPAQVEVRYARPSPFDVWVPGYWEWRGGRYVWIAGHWSRPPRGHRSWEAPRWERRGSNYIFIEGHWR